jgi:hypothetical protein
VSGLPDECGFDHCRRDVKRRTDRFYDEQVLQKEKNKPNQRKTK